jgi:hypothetical protein
MQAVKKLNGKDLIKVFEDSDETTCGLVGAKAPPRFFFIFLFFIFLKKII